MKHSFKALLLSGAILGACVQSSNAGLSEEIDNKDFSRISNAIPRTPYSRITNNTAKDIDVTLIYAIGQLGKVVQGNLDTGSAENITISAGKTRIFTPNEEGVDVYSVCKVKEKNSSVVYEGETDHNLCMLKPLRDIVFTTVRDTERPTLGAITSVFINLPK